MILDSSIPLADRDRLFADWSVAVVFRQVVHTYDPQTQLASETHTDTELLAIIGEAPARPTAATAAHHRTRELTVLIKAEDLPAPVASSTSRIVHQGTEYEVLRVTRSPADLTCTLECRS